jgi:hypothetical protein
MIPQAGPRRIGAESGVIISTEMAFWPKHPEILVKTRCDSDGF